MNLKHKFGLSNGIKVGSTTVLSGGGAAATPRSVFGSSLLGSWEMGELLGTAVIDTSGNGNNGTYTNPVLGEPGLGDGRTSVGFDGTGYANLFSAALASGFHGRAFSFFMNMRMAEVQWAENESRILELGTVNSNNYLQMIKQTTTLQIVYRANATSVTYNFNWYGGLFFFNLGIVVDQPNDNVIIYIDGEPVTTLTGLGDWSTTALTNFYFGRLAASAAIPFKGWARDVILVDGAATPAQVKQISAMRPAEQGAVMLAFDDASNTIYNPGFVEMSARNIPGTFYVISDLINQTANVTTANLLAMSAAGWSIGNHTKAGNSLIALSEADQETQLSACKNALDALGLTAASMHVSYPNGQYNADTFTAMAATGMLTGRNTRFGGMSDGQLHDLLVNGLYKLQPMPIIISTTSIDLIKGWVDDAINNKRVVQILVHSIGAGKDITTEDFTTLLDYIVSTGVRAITVKTWYDEYAARYA